MKQFIKYMMWRGINNMQKYMYLTDPTLTNKITLLKDKNLDDKLIKIIIEGGTLKSTIEELNAKIALLENNGERINAIV